MLDKERREEERASEDDTQVLSVEGVSDPGGDEPGTTAWFWCLPGAHLGQTPQIPKDKAALESGMAFLLEKHGPCLKELAAGEKRRLVLTGRPPFALQLPNRAAVRDLLCVTETGRKR